MDEFRFAMYWISSDQAREFDYWLRVPIRNRDLLAAEARAHYLRRRGIPPDASVRFAHGSFRLFLQNLEAAEEDVDRLILWFASIFEGLVDLDMQPGACKLWMEALETWARNNSLSLRTEMHGIDNSFLRSYIEEVFEPFNRFYEAERASGRRWQSGPEGRLPYDEFLSHTYFAEIRSYPAKFFYFFVEARLNREWWRKARKYLSAKQIEGLTEELVEYVSDTDIPEMIEWSHVVAIDEAFTIDRFPVFDEVASDW